MRWFWSSLLLITLCHPATKAASKLPKGWMRYRGNMCPLGCVDCDEVNGCTTCSSDRSLFLDSHGLRQFGLCLHACPLGYYTQRRGAFARCSKCGVEHCDVCASDNYCSRCRPPYLTSQGACIDTCPDDLHYAPLYQTCLPKVDCAVGPWQSWNPCSRNGDNCGFKYGIQTRRRSVLQSQSPGGVSCPEIVQVERCRMTHRYCADLITNKSDLGQIPSNAINRNKMSPVDRQRRLQDKKNRKRRRKRRHRKKRRWKVQQGHVVVLPDIATNSVETQPKAPRVSKRN